MSSGATLLIWFQLHSPDLADDFERLMADDRDLVQRSLDTVTAWRLMRPAAAALWTRVLRVEWR